MPEGKNVKADRESRELSVKLEWMLCSKSLSKALLLLNHTPINQLYG